ncbi:MAG: hypothetical protein AAF202_08160, partial [Pseudomonadota bacterium]
MSCRAKVLIVALALIAGSSSLVLEAKVFELQLSLPAEVAQPRWMYSESKSAPAKGIESLLWKAKEAQSNGKWKSCLNRIKEARPRAKGLSKWLDYLELRCSLKQGLSNAQRRTRVSEILSAIEVSPELVQFYKSSILTKELYWDVHFGLLDAESKASRSLAWKRIGRLLSFREELSESQVAKVYRISGDMAFIEQNLKACRQLRV